MVNKQNVQQELDKLDYECTVMRICPRCERRLEKLANGQHGAVQLKCTKCKKDSDFPPVFIGQPKIIIELA